METFKVIIVEDEKLELKGTEEIFRSDIPEAEILGTAMNEGELWALMRKELPDLLLLDLGVIGLCPPRRDMAFFIPCHCIQCLLLILPQLPGSGLPEV